MASIRESSPKEQLQRIKNQMLKEGYTEADIERCFDRELELTVSTVDDKVVIEYEWRDSK